MKQTTIIHICLTYSAYICYIWVAIFLFWKSLTCCKFKVFRNQLYITQTVLKLFVKYLLFYLFLVAIFDSGSGEYTRRFFQLFIHAFNFVGSFSAIKWWFNFIEWWRSIKTWSSFRSSWYLYIFILFIFSHMYEATRLCQGNLRWYLIQISIYLYHLILYNTLTF